MILLLALVVTLAPWKGPTLPTTPSGEYVSSYALTVRGAPHQRVDLRAAGVAKGWIAAFCTQTLCAPFRKTVTLGTSGTMKLEYELVRIDPKASHRTRSVISANGRVVATASVLPRE